MRFVGGLFGVLVSSLVLVLGSAAVCKDGDAIQKEETEYRAVLSSLESGNINVDYTALRLGYANTPEYSPYGSEARDLQYRMLTSFHRGDYSRAGDEADSLLALCYVSIDAHVVAMRLALAVGNETRATFHQGIVNGLVQSITRSTSGSGLDSAYVVISTDEEYALLRLWGLHLVEQALVYTDEGVPYDRLEVQDPETGKTRILYFDVSTPMMWLREHIERESGTQGE